eukprot:scaffold880_cov384-Prasinococcus_capsulatus_cf.AAC.17
MRISWTSPCWWHTDISTRGLYQLSRHAWQLRMGHCGEDRGHHARERAHGCRRQGRQGAPPRWRRGARRVGGRTPRREMLWILLRGAGSSLIQAQEGTGALVSAAGSTLTLGVCPCAKARFRLALVRLAVGPLGWSGASSASEVRWRRGGGSEAIFRPALGFRTRRSGLQGVLGSRWVASREEIALLQQAGSGFWMLAQVEGAASYAPNQGGDRRELSGTLQTAIGVA